MKSSITPLIWILSICISWGEVAIIRIPPEFIRYFASKTESPTDQERDPFEKIEEPVLAEPNAPEVVNPIATLIPGTAYNLKQGLKINGIALEDQDLALYFTSKHLLVIRSSPKTVNSIRMFFASIVDDELHPALEVTLRVREEMDTSSKDLCRLVTVTRSGCKLPVSDTNYNANIELTLTSNEGLVDTRISFSGRAELASKSVESFFIAETGEEVQVASWTTHEKSAFLCLKVQLLKSNKLNRSDAQLIELTKKVTKLLGNKDEK